MQQAAGGDRLRAVERRVPPCTRQPQLAGPSAPGESLPPPTRVLSLSGQRKMHTAGADPGTQRFHVASWTRKVLWTRIRCWARETVCRGSSGLGPWTGSVDSPSRRV